MIIQRLPWGVHAEPDNFFEHSLRDVREEVMSPLGNYLDMARHILVPIDGSDHSWDALDHALADYGAENITALHVVDPAKEVYSTTAGDYYTAEMYQQFHEKAMEEGEKLCEEAAKRVETAQNADEGTFETAIETGLPARTILEYASDHDVDHIVMGSHGRSGASRILFGSVAESVTRRAPVPVTIVR